VLLSWFRVFDGISDDFLQRCRWKRIGDSEVDAVGTHLYARILRLELCSLFLLPSCSCSFQVFSYPELRNPAYEAVGDWLVQREPDRALSGLIG
jgi:hypothetical protein